MRAATRPLMRLHNRLDMLTFRRSLRRTQTPAEVVLWGLVRGGRLGVRFRRQHAVGPFVLDFYCPSARLAVELDGHQGGGAFLGDAGLAALPEEVGPALAADGDML